MKEKYNIVFIPHKKDKGKISKLRKEVCKQVFSIQALQFPVHISLISGGFHTGNYSKFEKELKEFCKKQKPIKLKTRKKIAVLPRKFWTGISFDRNTSINRLQENLQLLRNKFAGKKQKHPFHPIHITLAFPAKVEKVKEVKNPVGDLMIDRISIVKRNKAGTKYIHHKHLKID